VSARRGTPEAAYWLTPKAEAALAALPAPTYVVTAGGVVHDSRCHRAGANAWPWTQAIATDRGGLCCLEGALPEGES
jgi:hypothetical protein